MSWLLKIKYLLSPYKSESQIMADADNGGYFSDVVVNQSSLGKDDKERDMAILLKLQLTLLWLVLVDVDYLSRYASRKNCRLKWKT